MSCLFDLFRRQSSHGFRWNGDCQRTLLHELDVEGRRFDLDASILETNLEQRSGFDPRIPSDPLRDNQPTRSINGSFGLSSQ